MRLTPAQTGGSPRRPSNILAFWPLLRRGMSLAILVLGLVLGRAGISAPPAAACTALTDAPSSRWSLASVGGRAWLITPCGKRFFSIGVNVVDGGASFRGTDRLHYAWQTSAPDLAAWIREVRGRLVRWGFNTVGAWSLAPAALRLPAVIDLELGRSARFPWFDPFDPRMPEIMRATARTLTAPYRHSPYRIGYFSDNEVGWWGGALFTYYSAQPAANHTKQRWVAVLRAHYGGDFARFAAEFVPPPGVDSWDALLQARAMTRLRPGSRGIDVVRRWTGIVADRYYRLAGAAIHAADPEALYLGDRLPIYYDPAALRAEARYADVVSTNYNVDSPDGWVAPYYFRGMRELSGGRPVLVSEWFYAARENRTGNRNNGHLMTVDTQAQRAAGAAAAAAAFARVPELIGLHWFQYYDDPQGGRADGEDYDFGLVDARDRPYERLVAGLGRINPALAAIHQAAPLPQAQPARPLVIPRATIDPADRSLAGWPKPAALLPPLNGRPGEVAFGEAYLGWSARGLALATIGQDYYDLDLLAAGGAFPLGEAFRVQLGVDAGAGPRRFTLYFIPPRSMVRGRAPLVSRFCRGASAEHRGSACPPVPGAVAISFGANQPRITGEVLIPWSALGLSRPPRSGRIRADVSATAWHRSRWMSLSGLSPEASASHPEEWVEMRLSGLLTIPPSAAAARARVQPRSIPPRSPAPPRRGPDSLR